MVQRAAVDRHRSRDGPPPSPDHEPADRQGPRVRRLTAGDARERWNRRYRERGVRALERAPSAWLVEQHALLTDLARSGGGRALDVACGDGRNAGYLAQLGFDVDAVDVSDVAIDALRAAADVRGLSVHPRRADLERGGLGDQRGLGEATYEVIVQINYLQRDLFGDLARALRPGGLLILETFTRADRDALGNHVEGRYLLEAGELPASFPGLEVIRHREAVVEHGERRRAVAGLVARRPEHGRAARGA